MLWGFSFHLCTIDFFQGGWMVNKLTIRYTLTFKFNIFGHKLSLRKENIQIISFKIKLLLILYTKLFIKRIQPNVAIKTTYCLLIIFKFIVSMIKFSNFTMFQKIMYVIYSFFNKKNMLYSPAYQLLHCLF